MDFRPSIVQIHKLRTEISSYKDQPMQENEITNLSTWYLGNTEYQRYR